MALLNTTVLRFRLNSHVVSAIAKRITSPRAQSPSIILTKTITSSCKAMQHTDSASKVLVLVRHGQAMHNVRAEPLKAQGCTFREFLDQMKEDDALDADLTEIGRGQATAASEVHKKIAPHLQLVVASTLSRAIDTANLIFPQQSTPLVKKRIAREDFREISGLLLNGKRSKLSVVQNKFSDWDFSSVVHEEDPIWEAHELEADSSVANRISNGIRWIWEQPETNLALVAHGGLLKHMLQRHPLIHCSGDQTAFTNCEVRQYRLSYSESLNKFELKPHQ